MHPVGRRGHVYQTALGINAHAAPAEMACVVGQGRHHQPVSPKQVVHREGVELFKLIIHPYGVLHLLNLAYGRHHILSGDDIGHLVLVQRIALDGQRTMDGLDAVDLTEHHGIALLHPYGEALHLCGDVCNQPHRLRRQRKRRLVAIICLCHLSSHNSSISVSHPYSFLLRGFGDPSAMLR